MVNNNEQPAFHSWTVMRFIGKLYCCLLIASEDRDLVFVCKEFLKKMKAKSRDFAFILFFSKTKNILRYANKYFIFFKNKKSWAITSPGFFVYDWQVFRLPIVIVCVLCSYRYVEAYGRFMCMFVAIQIGITRHK